MSSSTRTNRLGPWLALALAVPSGGILLTSTPSGKGVRARVVATAEEPAQRGGSAAPARAALYKMPIGCSQPFAE